MLISCKKAAQLESEAKDRKLTTYQRWSLAFHMGMCRVCRAYRAQLDILSRFSRQAGDLVMNRSDRCLSPDARERIKRKLSHPE